MGIIYGLILITLQGCMTAPIPRPENRDPKKCHVENFEWVCKLDMPTKEKDK